MPLDPKTHSRLYRTVVPTLLAIVFCAALFGQKLAEKQNFNVPAGDALLALREFAGQSSEQLLYSDAAATGVKTNAVKGAFTPVEALEVMLANTGLVATRDAKTGTLAVRKETDAEAKKRGSGGAGEKRPPGKPESRAAGGPDGGR